MRLVLASASPRRAELLEAAGFTFEVRAVSVDETVRPGERPADYVRRLAAEKSAASAVAGAWVLAADTAVVIDGVILGKPTGDADARRMLEHLSDRTHQVMTGVCLRRSGADPEYLSHVEATTVWFTRLSPETIDWYVASGEGRDKAGGYAIQGLASRFIPRIDGSYSNVVGLPVAVVHELTTRFAVPKFR